MTRKCLSCHSEVSSNVTKCPYCGKPFLSWFKRHAILSFIMALFVFSYIMSSIGSLFGTKMPEHGVNSEVTIADRREKTSWELADGILLEQKEKSAETQKKVKSLIEAESYQEAKDLLIERQKEIVAVMLEVRKDESLSEGDKKRVLEPMASEAGGLANEVKVIGEFQIDIDADRLLRSLE